MDQIIDNNKKVVVEFDKIHFSYVENLPILKNVNFQIFENEYVCIVGHNGSGKSTISKVLTGLLKPQSGTIKLFNTEIGQDNLKFLRNNIGIVFQNPDNQFVGLTVKDDIAFGLENRKVPRDKMLDIIYKAAEAVGVVDLLDKEPAELSGGQKQKVAIASVLAINPNIMIFDESTSMLDPKGKQELKELMLDLIKYANKTIISITHDMEEVVNADKVIVMQKGQVFLIGRPKEVFSDKASLEMVKLDFPFSLELSTMLKNKGIISDTTLDYEELIGMICQD